VLTPAVRAPLERVAMPDTPADLQARARPGGGGGGKRFPAARPALPALKLRAPSSL
jgi:hypothetical protein